MGGDAFDALGGRLAIAPWVPFLGLVRLDRFDGGCGRR